MKAGLDGLVRLLYMCMRKGGGVSERKRGGMEVGGEKEGEETEEVFLIYPKESSVGKVHFCSYNNINT